MKKTAMLAFVIGFIFLLSCSKIADDTPACIKNRINKFKTEDICSDAKVDEYMFQSQKVYVFSWGLCIADGTSEVISENCTSLGYLGGITGNNIINGESFGTAAYIRTVWEK